MILNRRMMDAVPGHHAGNEGMPMQWQVRPCTVEDVQVLREVEPPHSELAATFFEAQQAGGVIFLTAWDGSIPVGSGVLVTGAPGSIPELKNLHVHAEFRSRGVGSAVIRAAEEQSRCGGAQLMEVGVGIDNPRARALYERLGYRPTGQSATITYQYLDDEGSRRTATETSQQLVRQL